MHRVLKTDGQPCQTCLLWHCGFWCRAALPGEVVQQQQCSQTSPGHEIWRPQGYSLLQSLLWSLTHEPSGLVSAHHNAKTLLPFQRREDHEAATLLQFRSTGVVGADSLLKPGAPMPWENPRDPFVSPAATPQP